MNHCFKYLLFLCLLFWFLPSCGVEDCGCNTFSPINGRWYGKLEGENSKIELFINLTEKNSNLYGSGNLWIVTNSINFENVVSVKGSFVSNKIVISFFEIDSVSFEGMLNSAKDSIVGNFFVKSAQYPFSINKIK